MEPKAPAPIPKPVALTHKEMKQRIVARLSANTKFAYSEGRILRPLDYPKPIEAADLSKRIDQFDEETLQNIWLWRHYVLERVRLGAATLPERQVTVRSFFKPDPVVTMPIIAERAKLLCYQAAVDRLSSVIPSDEHLALQGHKQAAFREFKKPKKFLGLIPEGYTPSEMHLDASKTLAANKINQAVSFYKLAAMNSSITQDEKRDIHIELADCFARQKKYKEAFEYLKLAYLINLELAEKSEDYYAFYQSKGKEILIDLMRLIDIYCADIRKKNEKNNYTAMKCKERDEHAFEAEELLKDELNYLVHKVAANSPNSYKKCNQPRLAEYMFGCTLFADKEKKRFPVRPDLELRDGVFDVEQYEAMKSASVTNVHHYVAACLIQNVFSPEQLDMYITKILQEGALISGRASKTEEARAEESAMAVKKLQLK